MGIRDHCTTDTLAKRACEETDCSIRRECMRHGVILGEARLRRVLKAYAGYYNQVRTHFALAKDAPHPRPVQRLGEVAARPILGGLHHEYCRIQFSVGTGCQYKLDRGLVATNGLGKRQTVRASSRIDVGEDDPDVLPSLKQRDDLVCAASLPRARASTL
jgi:hypothetical protein